MKKILVIDDGANNQASATKSLADSGYEVVVAKNFEEGFSLLRWSHGDYEVVLLDLLMPCPKSRAGAVLPLGPEARQFEGQEMPFGFPLVFLAAMSGAQYIAVVTDANHHDHPMSAMLDPFEWLRNSGGVRLLLNGAAVKFFQYPATFPLQGTVCNKCQGTGTLRDYKCYGCYGSGNQLGKDWGMLLKLLLSDEEPCRVVPGL
ncbi:MAG: hypothetical protein WCV84_03215 [Patescibacteria group bacterium]